MIRVRSRRAVPAAVVAAVLGVLSACSSGQPEDDMQIGPSAVAATAAAAPVPGASPKGTVLRSPGPVTAMAVDQGSATLVVATGTPAALWLYSLAKPTDPPRRIAVAGAATELDPVAPGVLRAVVPAPGQLVTVRLPGGQVQVTPMHGTPVTATDTGGATLVGLRDRAGVGVLRDGRVTQLITGGLFGADLVLAAPGGTVVLDRRRTALFDVDVAHASIGAGLRAGLGATNAVVDRYGRVLVTDTRGGALLAFSVNPVLLRQNYPVPGAPYAIAYDPVRDLAWVTLTERNEVVGFDVRGGEPTEKYRFPTIRQPNAVAVDPSDGRVIVGSGDGAGVQVVGP